MNKKKIVPSTARKLMPRRIKRNGEANRARTSLRNSKGQLATVIQGHTEQRYRALFDLVPVAVYACDADGIIEEYNCCAVELWGQEPRRNGASAKFCGSYRIFHPDGRPMPHEKCPMARALRGEKLEPKDLEIVVERPDGERRHVIPAPQILKDSRGKIIGAINCLYDVTERERAQERLRQAREFDEAVMTNMGEGLYTVDAEGSVTTMNPAAEKFLGWNLEQLRGKKMHDVTHYKHRDGSPFPGQECPGLQVLRKGKSLTNCEDVFIRKDGTFFDVLYSSSPIRKGNKITGLVVVFRDITEQKRAEAAAMRLAALVRSSRDAVVAKDLNGIITDWNQSAQRIFGYKSKEIIGKSVLTLIPKDRQREEQEILRKIRRGESLDHYETVRRRKDGQLINVSLTISPIKNVKGEIVGVSKIARDITKQKQTERRLAEQARLLDLSNDAIIVRDHQDRIVYWNRGAEEMYGFSAKEAFGKIAHELLHTAHPGDSEKIRKKLERNNRWSGELVHTRKDGKSITVFSRWTLDRDVRGRPTSILETNTDITSRKRAEVALQQSKEALEQVVDQRTKELRIANTGLKNEIERRKGLEGEILSISDREQQRLGQELHDGLCQHLTAVAFMARSIALRLKNHRVIEVGDIEKIAQLVNDAATDMRNLSRALHRLDVDAAGLVNALQDLVDREIWRTPCRLEMKASFQINDDAAAAHLYRIAREAVINANKHAQAREIVVRLERVRKEMVLRVIDDGVGFPKDLKPQQGLGFHIMNYRAQLMGGRLEIDSPPQGGTRVSCYLPVVASRSREAQYRNVLPNGAAKLPAAAGTADQSLRHLARQGAANA
jgi:PAS domain S-box-containing protein